MDEEVIGFGVPRRHTPVTEVGPSDDFGLKVVEHVREHDDGAESEIPVVDTLQVCRAELRPKLAVDRFRCVGSVTESQRPTQTKNRRPLVEHAVSHIHDLAGGYVHEKQVAAAVAV